MKLHTFKQDSFLKNNQKVLADWCLKDPVMINARTLKEYENKIINRYHWNDRTKLLRDRKRINSYVEQIFKELKKFLNQHHKLNYPDTYWSTIILPWLNDLICNLFDKWEIIKLIKNKKKIELNVKKFKDNYFYLNRSDEYDNAVKDINDYIVSKIIEFKYKSKFKKINYYNHKKKISIKKKKFGYLKYIFFSFFSRFSSNKIIFHGLNFHNSIISFIILNLKKFQLPIFYFEKKMTEKSSYDKHVRKYIFRKNNKKDFLQFCRTEVSLLLPKSFLEDFKILKNTINSSYFPQKTKKILTSLNYRKNDFFQTWCAEQRLKGSKYFIFQHGGGYGYSDYLLDENYVNKISDKFLTWGWKKKSNKYKKFFCTKISYKFKHSPKYSSNILLNLHTYPRYSFRPVSKFKTNFDRLQNIENFKNLSNNIKNFNLTIRYLSRLNKEYDIPPFEKFFNKDINFDLGQKSFLKILDNYNLVVHDCFETTFLETVAYNIPTIVLTKNFKNQINGNFFKDFQNLKKIKVIHEDHSSICKMLNEKNFSIKKWWFQENNQYILNRFRQKFVKRSNNLLNDVCKLVD